MPRLTRALAATATAAVAVCLTGCSLGNPQTTQIQYAPSDGDQYVGSGLGVYNAIIISEGNGAPGVLVGTVANTTLEDSTLEMQSAPEAAALVQGRLDVPARSSVVIGPDGDEQIDIAAVDAVPGQSIQVFVLAGGTEEGELLIPVLDGTLAEYRDLVPTAGPTEPATSG